MTDGKKIYDFWEKAGLFKADIKSTKKTFSLLIPPPNLTGELHIGHAMQHSILDAVARFRRLQGFDVLILPGVDHAGIAFENTFDKELKKQNLSKEKLGREKWLEIAWQFKEKIYNSVSLSWRFMGLSADWSKEVFSLDEKRKNAVFHQFKKYYDDGLIYKGPYIVQWCPKCNTAIEDLEMEYEEKEEKLYYVRYKIENTEEDFVEIATTRPETIFADTAVAVYPNHPKYKKFVGEKAINPLTKNPIPVIEDKRVEKDFGTGALKITPAHDLLDYQIGKDNKLEILHAVNKEGKLTDITGELGGLKIGEAKEKVVDKLRALEALTKEEDYKHSVAVCERCKTTVEPLISEEWFVKVDQLAKGAIEIINADKIKFLPKNYKKIILEWLTDIHDWCISRSLWWGHRIPVWYHGNEIKVTMESPGPEWKQDEQVLDTWFSSGLWPLSTLGWPDKTKEFGHYFPWDFEISAPEIKFLWIARMVMISNYITGKEPFKTMFFHGMLRDLEGRKFSKSLGNGIEPHYLIDKWGTDATRMALYSYSIPGRDGRVSKEILDERGKNFRNFATKMRNISRFILELKPDKSKSKLEFKYKDDKWIKTELDKTITAVTKNLEETQLHLASEEIYEFIWHSFADIYLEKSKKRRDGAQPVLEHVLKNCLIALHPFMPFLTEEIYQKFENKKKSIMLEEWPTATNA
ncbi:MAG TPA: valine--tRNA ligase [Patescibacteria group bacterium]|nr:valine--tRNA ligase [Patescibacteria group bacterium]